GVHVLARRVAGDQLQNRGPDQNAVTFFEAGPLDLLAVDERAVRRAEILDPYLVALHRDAGVFAAHHVLDEPHVEVAGAADEDLLLRGDGEFPALILPTDEAQNVGPPRMRSRRRWRLR